MLLDVVIFHVQLGVHWFYRLATGTSFIFLGVNFAAFALWEGQIRFKWRRRFTWFRQIVVCFWKAEKLSPGSLCVQQHHLVLGSELAQHAWVACNLLGQGQPYLCHAGGPWPPGMFLSYEANASWADPPVTCNPPVDGFHPSLWRSVPHANEVGAVHSSRCLGGQTKRQVRRWSVKSISQQREPAGWPMHSIYCTDTSLWLDTLWLFLALKWLLARRGQTEFCSTQGMIEDSEKKPELDCEWSMWAVLRIPKHPILSINTSHPLHQTFFHSYISTGFRNRVGE